MFVWIFCIAQVVIPVCAGSRQLHICGVHFHRFFFNVNSTELSGILGLKIDIIIVCEHWYTILFWVFLILKANLLHKAHKLQNITEVYSFALNKDTYIMCTLNYNHRSTSHVYNVAHKINGGKWNTFFMLIQHLLYEISSYLTSCIYLPIWHVHIWNTYFSLSLDNSQVTCSISFVFSDYVQESTTTILYISPQGSWVSMLIHIYPHTPEEH